MGKGIFGWCTRQGRVYCLSNEKELKIYRLKNTNVRKFDFDVDGNVWVATYGRGLLKINPVSAQVNEFLIDEKRNKISENDINTILSFNSSYLLVGTVNKGVQRFDFHTEKFTPFLEKGQDNSPLFVRCMIKTDNQELWIGTEEGVFIYDLRTNDFVNLKHSHNNPYSLSDNAIHSLYQDKEGGGVWVGTFFGGGVSYFHNSFTQFENTIRNLVKLNKWEKYQ